MAKRMGGFLAAQMEASVHQHIAAWERFALRDCGFMMGSGIAFEEREDRQEVLEGSVHRLMEPRVRGGSSRSSTAS